MRVDLVLGGAEAKEAGAIDVDVVAQRRGGDERVTPRRVEQILNGAARPIHELGVEPHERWAHRRAAAPLGGTWTPRCTCRLFCC
jgi:hypothetical protein